MLSPPARAPRPRTIPARALALHVLGSLALFTAAAERLRAQSTGATVPVAHTLPFETHGQSMWGPANAPSNIDFSLSLLDETWSETGQISDIRDAIRTQWGGSIGGSSSGVVGLSLRMFDVGTGAVDVAFPVRVTLDVPAPNSFRDGAEVTIGSRVEFLPGWELSTTPPGGSLTLAGKFGSATAATGRVCFFGCSAEITLVPAVNIPVSDFELFSIASEGKLVFNEIDPPGIAAKPLTIQTLPYVFGCLLDCGGAPDLPLIGELIGFTGPVDAPTVRTEDSFIPIADLPGGDAGVLQAVGAHRFVDLTVDLDRYLTLGSVPQLGVQTNPALSLVTGASFGYDIAAIDLGLGVTQRHTFRFNPKVMVTVAFPQAVSYTVLSRTGAPEPAQFGTSATFEAGGSVRVVFPGGVKAPQAGTPTYVLGNRFRSEVELLMDDDLVLSAGRFELTTPSKTVSASDVSTVCSFGWIAIDVCNFFGGILRTITNTITEVAPPVAIDLGPLTRKTVANETHRAPLHADEWELQGFQPFVEAPFLLDPEDPRIAVATTLGSAALAGGPTGSILQTVTVRNEGDVALSALQLRDAVSAAIGGGAFQVAGVSSPTLTPGASFDGISNTLLLGGGDAIEAGATATVSVLLAATPGSIYQTSLRGDGASPIGTPVDASASGSIGVVVFEILPDQISAWSQGVLPVRILGAGIDAARIDPSSLTLEGIAPSHTDLTTGGTLNLKFALPEVLAALDRRLAAPATAVTLVRGPGGTSLEVSASDVAAAVMGDAGRLTQVTVAAVDRLGNSDGRLDLGDLRAVVMASRAGTPGGPSLAVSSQQRALVVTGTLTDGTPFFGEDDLSVMYGGQ